MPLRIHAGSWCAASSCCAGYWQTFSTANQSGAIIVQRQRSNCRPCCSFAPLPACRRAGIGRSRCVSTWHGRRRSSRRCIGDAVCRAGAVSDIKSCSPRKNVVAARGGRVADAGCAAVPAALLLHWRSGACAGRAHAPAHARVRRRSCVRRHRRVDGILWTWQLQRQRGRASLQQRRRFASSCQNLQL